jgi:hypothetical protein
LRESAICWMQANTAIASTLIWLSMKSSGVCASMSQGARLDGRREHMSIVGVGELKVLDQRLVASDQAVWDRVVDQGAQARQPVGRDVRPVPRQGIHSLGHDLSRPLRLEQPSSCYTDVQVA